MSPDPGRFRGEIERRTRAVRCGEARRKRSEGKFTLAATLRECTPGRSRAAAATDPPTPTGDEKGRENERAGESLRGITVVAIENEREEGQRRGRVRWMLRFQLRARPAKISKRFDAGNRSGKKVRERFD